VGAGRGGALGRRVDELQRILSPLAARLGIGEATPQIDDLLPLDEEAEGGTDLAVVGEVCGERVSHLLEARCDVSVDGDVTTCNRCYHA